MPCFKGYKLENVSLNLACLMQHSTLKKSLDMQKQMLFLIVFIYLLVIKDV